MDPLGVVVRFGLYLNLMILFGAPLFGIYSPQPRDRRRVALRVLRRLYAAGAVVGLALSLVSLMVLAASMSGQSVGDVRWSTLEMLVLQTNIGWAWLVRVAALTAFILASWVMHPARGAGPTLMSLLGGVALASLAWTGHGAMDQGSIGLVHLSADIVHLLAAGAWIAAILALGTLLIRVHRSMSRDDAEHLHRALARFATIGTLAVALLFLTGLVNSWLLVGISGLASVGDSLYLQLLALKLLLFLGMLCLAAANRFTITPTLERVLRTGEQGSALAHLRRSLAIEASLGIAILGLVAWFGTLNPPSAGM
ncbi:MAG TPA: copper homeostasis membrane protein CopD [Sphingomonas sp.]|nr:copper homeostasis membrane protein CopD [Sphingomonas sp.]